jgi:hypothetical protein
MSLFRLNIRSGSLKAILQGPEEAGARGSSRAVMRMDELPSRLRGGGCEGISLFPESSVLASLGLSVCLGMHWGLAEHSGARAGLRIAVRFPSVCGDGRFQHLEFAFRKSGIYVSV